MAALEAGLCMPASGCPPPLAHTRRGAIRLSPANFGAPPAMLHTENANIREPANRPLSGQGAPRWPDVTPCLCRRQAFPCVSPLPAQGPYGPSPGELDRSRALSPAALPSRSAGAHTQGADVHELASRLLGGREGPHGHP